MGELSQATGNLNILDLPLHYLENVFDYVGEKGRKNLSLTCSQFHAIVGEMKTYRMNINDDNVMDDAFLITKRKFGTFTSSIDISDDVKLERMTEILKIHGSNIKRMYLDSWKAKVHIPAAKASQVFGLFKLVPNLKIIEFGGKIWKFEKICDLEPKLEYVETLKIDYEGEAIRIQGWFATIFKPNTIKTLETNKILKNFDKFIEMQLNIKDLTISHHFVRNLGIFDNLKLNSITLSDYWTSNENSIEEQNSIHQFIMQHPELKSIKGDKFKQPMFFFPRTIQLIRGLESLECLHMYIAPENVSALHQLSNLPTIKKVVFTFHRYLFTPFEFDLLLVSSIRLPTIEKVILKNERYKFSDKTLFIENMALNWPRLMKLKFTNPYEGGIDFLNELLDNLPRLEKLKIYQSFSSSLDFRNTQTQYGNLKELDILGDSSTINNLASLLECTPNVEILSLSSFTLFDPQILRNLAKLGKLKKIRISFEFKSDEEGHTREEVELLLKLSHRLDQINIYYKTQPFSEELKALVTSRFNIREHRFGFRGKFQLYYYKDFH